MSSMLFNYNQFHDKVQKEIENLAIRVTSNLMKTTTNID